MLPINEMGHDNSPYNAISAMAIELTTLHLAPGSPEELTRADYERLLGQADLAKLRHGSVKYELVKKLKRGLLERAFANFSGSATRIRQGKFQQFCEREGSWLNDYAFFRTLVEENGDNEAWDKWPLEQRQNSSAHRWLEKQPTKKQTQFRDREKFFRYAQWIAGEQWSGIKSHAGTRGVALMGDVPFGINYYSADVFTRPNEFVLDWCGGAPPESHFKDDKFTQKWGQNWGIPLFRWDMMRQRNFDWWRQRVRSVRRSFHLFRIDHVLGFYRIYSFPWRPQQNKKFLSLDWYQSLQQTGGRAPHFQPRDDQGPSNGEANRHEGEQYLRPLLEESGDARLIGEDLGTVPDYVRPSLRSLGIAGF